MTHELIEGLIVFLLAVLTCLAAIGAISALLWFYLDGPGWSAGIDVVGSQYVKDGRFDWSTGDLPKYMQGAPRVRENGFAAYRDGDTEYEKGKGEVMPAEIDWEEEGDGVAQDTPSEEDTAIPTMEWTAPENKSLTAEIRSWKALKPRKV